MTILEKLEEAKVFRIRPKDGNFKVREECDGYFFMMLTKEELLQLADEITQLMRRNQNDN